jgi:hypothetical protein
MNLNRLVMSAILLFAFGVALTFGAQAASAEDSPLPTIASDLPSSIFALGPIFQPDIPDCEEDCMWHYGQCAAAATFYWQYDDCAQALGRCLTNVECDFDYPWWYW